MTPQQQIEFNIHIHTHFASLMALALCADTHTYGMVISALQGTWECAHKAGRIAQHDSDIKVMSATSIPMGARVNEIARIYIEVVRENSVEDN